jgi:hypothetical protein
MAEVEAMTERDEAIKLAHAVLDKPYIDPDGDICMLARQFLRAVEGEWLPIDTAPKDGTKVLVSNNHRWFGICSFEMPQAYADYPRWCIWMFGYGGWRLKLNDEAWVETADPTHWMPRPFPPSEDR